MFGARRHGAPIPICGIRPASKPASVLVLERVFSSVVFSRAWSAGVVGAGAWDGSAEAWDCLSTPDSLADSVSTTVSVDLAAGGLGAEWLGRMIPAIEWALVTRIDP